MLALLLADKLNKEGFTQQSAVCMQVLDYYQRAAGQGCGIASRKLGYIYDFGHFGEGKSPAVAAQHYMAAARHGDTDGQGCIAECYLRGEGVEPSLARAVYWYSKNCGGELSADICFSIGCYYYHNRAAASGVLPPAACQARGIYWLEQAARLGHSNAQNDLGTMLIRRFDGHGAGAGAGDPKDEEDAMHWYSKAADQGHELAREFLVHARESDLRAELARELAREFQVQQQADDELHQQAGQSGAQGDDEDEETSCDQIAKRRRLG